MQQLQGELPACRWPVIVMKMQSTKITLSFIAVFISSIPSQAAVSVLVDLSNQQMHVSSSRGSFNWPISSGRTGFSTPGGSYAPIRLELMHYSRKFHMAPMPHAIFFHGGYAIHGTYNLSSLGEPASHGCVRLSPGNAAVLYSLVKAEGAKISITGSPPSGTSHVNTARRQVSQGTQMLAESEMRSHHRASADGSDYDLEQRYAGYRYLGNYEGRRVYQALPKSWSGYDANEE